MAMPIDALGTPASLASGQIRQTGMRAAVEPQRAEPAAPGGEGRQARERIAAQAPAAPPPSIRVEYQQNHPVLMLHDQRGVLIYQVPPKGALQLIRQAEAPGNVLNVQA
jgi:hypothetical protein